MKTIKVGILGVGGRGKTFHKNVVANGGQIVAACDISDEYLKRARENWGENVATYTDFDLMIECEELDVVVLSNYFHEHAPYAIKALEKNIHVLSECTSNVTMAEGVALVRAAEKSRAFYMIAENYPYMRHNREIKELYDRGDLGRVIYGECEYNHPISPHNLKEMKNLCPSSKHWRYNIPRTYYITHSLAPLMHITGSIPKRVIALPVAFEEPITYDGGISRGALERVAIIMTQNNDGSVFRLTGTASFGGHECSTRVCGDKGQMESLRDGSHKVAVHYNEWDKPEGLESNEISYVPEWPEKDRDLIIAAGHGGGDFIVIRELFGAIRENRKPEFDEYFATTMASVAILGHRSLLENGAAYDIPDFHKEEDRVKYENDTLSPFYHSDGRAPSIRPSNHTVNFTPEDMARYDAAVAAIE
jgi:predicted dehydrogenase